MARVCIGTSGWNYDHWRGVFYPEGLPRARWLGHYAQTFSSVEVNATFYRQMRPSTFEKWRQGTPEGFLWAVKASRFITHIKRLADAQGALSVFMKSLEPLREKLGPILFQLPPTLFFDKGLCEAFCSLLPAVHRYALEARHASWTESEALQCLADHCIAWCISDTAGRYPSLEAVTADFVYVRLHGSTSLYASCYSEEELRQWAARIRDFGRDAYVYFDNDFMGYAPKNALRLLTILG
ncbi:MAG: DUF72 domain-containing protein [Deltaproteobacteria bacterium]|nr:DUF72 domain-containing protein [Deltaproteobacteria bacterium]